MANFSRVPRPVQSTSGGEDGPDFTVNALTTSLLLIKNDCLKEQPRNCYKGASVLGIVAIDRLPVQFP